MQNHLKNQTSPYLLQHADNPVNWYPWCAEAFKKAKTENKPIFLSIGYSTCHWCHVMAHESFEDEEVANLLNQNFVSIKVDKEERPDIDSVYMSVCQALTGSGGWPTTIFMTPEQKPFFAGTYFPKHARYGSIGFLKLLETITEKWDREHTSLLDSAEQIIESIKKETVKPTARIDSQPNTDPEKILNKAIYFYQQTFDKENGGFGHAPKFPAAHNLLFLLNHFERTNDIPALEMVERTLLQMYRGGIFDHIGGGFSRYSTDNVFLVPHFEKMLYDNALLIMSYVKAYELTHNMLYLDVAEKTASYILREMTSPQGGFYSAQDADSDGIEGKYYLFEPKEIWKVLDKEDAEAFCQYFNITDEGNFEGKSIPNLLQSEPIVAKYNTFLPKVYEYRKNRYQLPLDDKILTSWNGLMIVAMCYLYRTTNNEKYLIAAEQAQTFIEHQLCENDSLFVSWREGQRSGKGFLDDYSNEIFALLSLYEATLDESYLLRAQLFCDKCISVFYDEKALGFFMGSNENEKLIVRPKETYDGAMPSGNSIMTYNLVRLSYYLDDKKYKEITERQIQFMLSESSHYPSGYAMFLTALLDHVEPPTNVTIVTKNRNELKGIACRLPLNSIIKVLGEPTQEYPLKDGKTTYYICKGHSCQPATNMV